MPGWSPHGPHRLVARPGRASGASLLLQHILCDVRPAEPVDAPVTGLPGLDAGPVFLHQLKRIEDHGRNLAKLDEHVYSQFGI